MPTRILARKSYMTTILKEQNNVKETRDIFIADDGKEFTSETECLKHEATEDYRKSLCKTINGKFKELGIGEYIEVRLPYSFPPETNFELNLYHHKSRGEYVKVNGEDVLNRINKGLGSCMAFAVFSELHKYSRPTNPLNFMVHNGKPVLSIS